MEETRGDDLPTILGRFRTGLLPYRVGHPMTDHVNPDKLHHYLSAGLEVVASPIPAARRLKRYLHLMTTDGDWATLLSDLPSGRQNNWPRETLHVGSALGRARQFGSA